MKIARDKKFSFFFLLLLSNKISNRTLKNKTRPEEKRKKGKEKRLSRRVSVTVFTQEFQLCFVCQ